MVCHIPKHTKECEVLNKVISDDSLHFTNELNHVLYAVIWRNFKYKLMAKAILITVVLNITPYGTLMPRLFCCRIFHLQNACSVNCTLRGPIDVGRSNLPSRCSTLYTPHWVTMLDSQCTGDSWTAGRSTSCDNCWHIVHTHTTHILAFGWWLCVAEKVTIAVMSQWPLAMHNGLDGIYVLT